MPQNVNGAVTDISEEYSRTYACRYTINNEIFVSMATLMEPPCEFSIYYLPYSVSALLENKYLRDGVFLTTMINKSLFMNEKQ